MEHVSGASQPPGKMEVKDMEITQMYLLKRNGFSILPEVKCDDDCACQCNDGRTISDLRDHFEGVQMILLVVFCLLITI